MTIAVDVDYFIEVKEERDMLADENKKMAKFLLDDGYTLDDVDNIAKGFPIDKGGKYEANN
jgi:di/tripeptidase